MSKQNEHEWLDFKSFKFHNNWIKDRTRTHNYEYDLNMDYLITECCVDKTIVYTDQQPTGFKIWADRITYDKCKAYLPDGTVMDIKAYITNQGDFDSGSYTKTLLHSYNGLFL